MKLDEAFPSPDSTRRIPTPMEAYNLLLLKIEDTTPEDIAHFRELLTSEAHRKTFDSFSCEAQLTTVAYQSLPVYVTYQLRNLPEYVPIVHDVRTLISAQNLLRSIMRK